VVALGILLAAATGLADRGVALIGTIPPGLPQFAAPDLDLVGGLLAPAAGVALMAFVESIAAGRAFTAKGEPEVDADQELRALGAANLAGGCFQASPTPGSDACSGIWTPPPPPSPPPIHPLRVMNPGPVRRHHERASGRAAGER
jgi:SulP family sulfate permease